MSLRWGRGGGGVSAGLRSETAGCLRERSLRRHASWHPRSPTDAPLEEGRKERREGGHETNHTQLLCRRGAACEGGGRGAACEGGREVRLVREGERCSVLLPTHNGTPCWFSLPDGWRLASHLCRDNLCNDAIKRVLRRACVHSLKALSITHGHKEIRQSHTAEAHSHT